MASNLCLSRELRLTECHVWNFPYLPLGPPVPTPLRTDEWQLPALKPCCGELKAAAACSCEGLTRLTHPLLLWEQPEGTSCGM